MRSGGFYDFAPLPGGCSGMFHCLDDDGKRSYAAAAYRAGKPGTLLISCFSDANPNNDEFPLPVVSEEALRDVLGGAGWHIASLEPATVRREREGADAEMAFCYVRADRR